MTSIDRHRSALYRVEDQWSATLDRGGVVDFFGSTLDAPVQMRFGSLADAQTYVRTVCMSVALPLPAVRARKGGTRAHYENHPEPTIAIPEHEPWAMRESVLLHEISHHMCVTSNNDAHHGEDFTATMLMLTRVQLGEAAELLLRTGYQAAGIPIAETVPKVHS